MPDSQTFSGFRRAALLTLGLAFAWLFSTLWIQNPYLLLVMTLVPLWATLGVSWNTFSGYSGLLSFGHAAFFGLGAYAVAIPFAQFDVSPWLTLPMAAGIGALAGLLVGIPTFRLRGVYFSLAMLSYPLAMMYVFEWLGYQEVTLPLKREQAAAYMQFSDQRVYVLIATLMLVAAVLLQLRIGKSRFGLSLLAIKQNEMAAETAGINPFRWKLLALVLSATMAGLAGGLYAVVLVTVTPPSVFGMLVSAQALIFTMFGGTGWVAGPIIGTVILLPLSEFLTATLGVYLPGIQGVLYGVAIILVVLMAPEGLLPRMLQRPQRLGVSAPAAAVAASLVQAAQAPRTPAPSQDARAAHTDDHGPKRKPHSSERGQVRQSLFGAEGSSNRGAEAPAPQGDEALHTPDATADADVPVIMRVTGLSKQFGGLQAVGDVSFDVYQGEILGIIGPNGAGKTTLFNLLNGIIRPSGGSVVFNGQRLTGLKPFEVNRLGVGRTFQVARAFTRLSVLENVLVAALSAEPDDARARARAHAALVQVGLDAQAHARAEGLTAVQLRLMEIARALASGPKLLLLDEILAGLGGKEITQVIDVLQRVRTLGMTQIVIEHTMHAMVKLADRLLVLDHGRTLFAGAPAAVTSEPAVIEAYLGKKWVQHAAH